MTRKADGIRRRWCKPSHPAGVGAHGSIPTTMKGVDLMQNKNRWAIYARRAGHKRAHPCSPSKGLYNCSLADLDRYATFREADSVRSFLAHENSNFHFSVRYLRSFS